MRPPRCMRCGAGATNPAPRCARPRPGSRGRCRPAGCCASPATAIPMSIRNAAHGSPPRSARA
ncbi:hypothetical protein FE772_06910 [Lysobacter enzymogenes]|nr:hypothetical protein FE772_06910 [Lysobacter enzymogenes]